MARWHTFARLRHVVTLLTTANTHKTKARTQKWAFSHWVRRARGWRYKREDLRDATLHHRHWRLRRALRLWSTHTQLASSKRHQWVLWTTFRRDHLMQWAWGLWHQHHSTVREDAELAYHARRQFQRGVIRRWLAFTDRRRALHDQRRVCDRHWRTVKLQQGIAQWRDHHRERGHTQALLQRAVRRWNLAMGAACFDQWVDFVVTQRLLRRAVAHFRSTATARCFKQWRQQWHTASQLRALGARAEKLRDTHRMRRCMNTWKQAVVLARVIRAWVSRSQHTLLARIVTRWRAFAIESRERKERSRVGLRRWIHRRASNALGHWLAWTRYVGVWSWRAWCLPR